LRYTVAVIAVAVFTLLGSAGLQSVAAAESTSAPVKVVIIVGPVEGTTSSYRAMADDAYNEAIKYTPDVTKVYSPNATWSAVKAATTGASLVVYLGHGNGWPSPYTYDPLFTTKDGFGLNAAAGKGDSNNKYYGEPSVSTLDLAPDAVVILNHLCYASGNSEPGDPEPDQVTARQRVDNFAAAFLAGNASAVIADGHSSVTAYIASLFTTDLSMEDVWRSAPNVHGHELSFGSTRTPGATAYTDTDAEDSGYYRSLVTEPDVTAADFRAGAGRTSSTASTVHAATDIASSKFAADIDWLYAAGLTVGCSPSRFCPDGKVTRGQMASFLARALKLPATSTDYFDDDTGLSHEANINRIAEAGVTVGCGGGRYCPTGLVTRAQMASFLARALDLPPTKTDHFWDDNGLSHEPNINRIAEAGVTYGCGDGRYCPSGAVTRGQMAAFLHRAFGG
jgi:hypothetical protein